MKGRLTFVGPQGRTRAKGKNAWFINRVVRRARDQLGGNMRYAPEDPNEGRLDGLYDACCHSGS